MIDRNKLIALAAVAAALVALIAGQRGCRADSLPAPLEGLVARLEAPGQPQWKKDLVRQAIAHESKPWRAHTVFYHPAEAGADWRRWSRTATGTLVRPGVASCTQANRNRWMGAWVYFEGYGIAHVEDCFPEASSPTMFDLAVWAQPGQSYADWLSDPTRVVIARTRNLWTDAITLKPKGGWPQ